MHKTISFLMKNLSVATAIVFLSSEVFAIERCPEVVRAVDLKKMEDLKDGDTFQWKGESWIVVSKTGTWMSYLKEGRNVVNTLEKSHITIHKDKEVLQCRYAILSEYIMRHSLGNLFVDTIITD